MTSLLLNCCVYYHPMLCGWVRQVSSLTRDGKEFIGSFKHILGDGQEGLSLAYGMTWLL